MVSSPKLSCAPIVILMVIVPVVVGGQTPAPSDIVGKTEQKVVSYLDSLADLHCSESVTQEKLSPTGHVESTVRAKYDYLIMMQGDNDDFQLNETRVAEGSNKVAKPSPVSMLVSNGISTALLIFHPYYRGSYDFHVGETETNNGRSLVPIHFQQISGRRSPAALSLRGREYPLELEGTAWVDKETDDVVRVDAGLEKDMSDIGLRALQIHVEYSPVSVGRKLSSVDLPTTAVVDVTTPRQHWRNTHAFEAYKSFSTQAEQDPNVKVHGNNSTDDTNANPSDATPDSKEKQ
jgi:hypothetical protein